MTKKLFTLLLAVAASVGTMFADGTKIGDLYYNLDATNQTAEVTYHYGSYSSGDIIIPSSVTYNTVSYSVTSIGGSAFSGCTGLITMTIPNSVTSIGNNAFAGCTGLTSVTIPNSVTSIGKSAFERCSSLTSVTIPNSVTSIGYEAFYGCSGLTSPVYNAHVFAYLPTSYSGAYTIPDGIESIAGGAFEYCSGLTSVTIGNNVASIGFSAFGNCTGLTSVTIPNSVTSIESSAFSYCTGLTNLIVQNSDIQNEGSIFLYSTALKYISAPACIFDIHSAYTSYPSYFPQKLDSIKVIGGELSENALWVINLSRKTLKSVDMSGTVHTDLADEAFKEFYNLQQLILPANLTHIGYKSVAECVKLQSIDIPASVEEIDDRAFEDCRSIKSITFGGAPAGAPGRFNAPAASASQLRRIGNWAFYNAHELQHLDIPEGVTEIGDGAFYGCTYLEDMTLPASIQAIGDNCFALCAKLQKITCNAVTPPAIEAKTFFDVKRQIPVYVPDEAVSAYENDTYWHEFDIQGQSEAPQGIEEISSSLQRGERGRLILRNGQIYIIRGDKTYTLQGQELK